MNKRMFLSIEASDQVIRYWTDLGYEIVYTFTALAPKDLPPEDYLEHSGPKPNYSWLTK